ncbi:MAG: WD40 repeat domain-containing protein, partial [Thermaurantiacus sp.]
MPTLTRASFADGGGRLVLAHDDDTIRLWSIEGEPLSDPVQIKGRAVGAGFLLGGKRVYVVTAAGVLHLFDGERLEPVIDPVSQQAGFLLAAPSDDGKLLFAADSANQVDCFGAEDGAKVGGPVVHRAAVTTIVAPAGGRLRTMLTGSADGLARAWVLPAGQPGTEYAHGAPIRALGVGPRCLWTLGDDETVRLFDLASGRPLRDPLPSKRVTAAASLGELLITGSRDGSIRGWKLPSGDEAAGMALRVEAAVLALQLSPA